MNRSRTLVAALTVSLGYACLGTGCTAALIAGAAATGIAGTYVYTEGRLDSVEDAPLAAVHEAALKAVGDLGFTLRSEASDAFASSILARRADDSDVRISLEKKSDDSTSVRIRVGILGDEEVSTQILLRIRENLGN